MRFAVVLLSFAMATTLSFGAAARVEKGSVRFEPLGDQKNIPKMYQLEKHRFDYELSLKTEMRSIGARLYQLRFPSPVKSPYEVNNTVYGEYYRPRGPGPFPGVIVLDITGGNQELSRIFSTHFSQKGIAALFVQMAYYGPRRPPGGKVKLLSTNMARTMSGVRQTVLDLRRATAWLASRPEVDSKRLGILGTSLGSLIGSLTAEMEPRLRRVAILLGGGGLVDAYYDHPEAAPYRGIYEKLGGTKEQVKKVIAPYDPLTRAGNLKDRKVLIIAGKKDKIVPPQMAQAMWEASGRQKLVWYNCGHYTAALYIIPALREIVNHLKAPVEN